MQSFRYRERQVRVIRSTGAGSPILRGNRVCESIRRLRPDNASPPGFGLNRADCKSSQRKTVDARRVRLTDLQAPDDTPWSAASARRVTGSGAPCGKLWGKGVEQLWLDFSFIHNFFANGSFLIWTSSGSRATIPAVRKSTDVPCPGSWRPARLEGRYQAPGARNGHQDRKGCFPDRLGFSSCVSALWRPSGRRAWQGNCRISSGDRGVRSGEGSRVIRRLWRCMRRWRLLSVFRCDCLPPWWLSNAPACRKARRDAIGTALDGLSSDGPTRAAGPGRNAAVVRRLPPCAWRIGSGLRRKARRSHCGRHPLASAKDGGLSPRRFAHDRDRAHSVSRFGRR